MELPKYWRYIDTIATVGITILVTGTLLLLYYAYLEVARSSLEAQLVLIGIALTIFGIIVTMILGLLAVRAMKIELRKGDLQSMTLRARGTSFALWNAFLTRPFVRRFDSVLDVS